MSDLPNPVTREQFYLKAIAEGASGGGSGGLFYITVTDQTGNVFIIDKTYQEIIAAIQNGLIPILVSGGYWDDNGLIYYGYYHYFMNITEDNELDFAGIPLYSLSPSGSIGLNYYRISPDNTTRYNNIRIALA